MKSSTEDIKRARRRRISEEISDALRDAGMSRKEFAARMHRQPSEVTRWLSGNHNFTSDLLAEISQVLSRQISGVDALPAVAAPFACVAGYDAAPAAKLSLRDSSSVALNIDLPASAAEVLCTQACASGRTFREYVVDLLCDKAQERPESALDFCGIWDESFPDCDEISSFRTENTFPVL